MPLIEKGKKVKNERQVKIKKVKSDKIPKKVTIVPISKVNSDQVPNMEILIWIRKLNCDKKLKKGNLLRIWKVDSDQQQLPKRKFTFPLKTLMLRLGVTPFNKEPVWKGECVFWGGLSPGPLSSNMRRWTLGERVALEIMELQPRERAPKKAIINERMMTSLSTPIDWS